MSNDLMLNQTDSAVSPSTPHAVSLHGISKTFGDSVAVHPVSLDIEENEFFSILGPSGCGKTTLMRMIAGFETPTSGRVQLGGNDVTGVPTRKRDLNMLFQSYALFPHLTVFDNVVFELRVRRVPKAEANQRASEALELVKLGHLADRKPDQLSGGQRQRVALARAVVSGPKVVLLDEPLGALDQQLRKEMQLELKRMQREVGITFIYVTHDQEEALTMSDRIAVMSEGVVEQVATAEEIYNEPQTRFVAGFIGECNLIDVQVPAAVEGQEVAAEADGVGTLYGVLAEGVSQSQPATFLIRPERMKISRTADGLATTVSEIIFLGEEWHIKAVVGTQEFKVSVTSLDFEQELAGLRVGEPVNLSWRTQDARIVIQ